MATANVHEYPLTAVPDSFGTRLPTLRLLVVEGTAQTDDLRAAARDCCEHLAQPYASRSYALPFAVVAANDRRVGIDIEHVDHFGREEAESILTPAELRLGLAIDNELFTSIWTSKEALAKALGNARLYDPRRIESPLFWPQGASGRWRASQLDRLEAEYVGWVCWQA